jgi:hypothetical protein
MKRGIIYLGVAVVASLSILSLSGCAGGPNIGAGNIGINIPGIQTPDGTVVVTPPTVDVPVSIPEPSADKPASAEKAPLN